DVRRAIWRPPVSEQPEAPKLEPTFHVFASEWVERRRHEVDARTVEYWQWALSSQLLASFAELRPSQISVAAIDGYKLEKLRERERLEAPARTAERADRARAEQRQCQQDAQGAGDDSRRCDRGRLHRD